MNTKSTSVFIVVFFAFSSLVFFSCKKGEDIDPTQTTVDTGSVIVKEVIGSSGGVFEGGSLTVDIPAGAFSGNQELSISKMTDRAFGSNQVTDIWFVNKLPLGIGNKVKLKLDGVVPKEGFVAMLAEVVFVQSLNQKKIVYHPVDYKIVGGGIEIEIPRPVKIKSGSIDLLKFEFSAGVVGVAGMTTDINPENPKFKVYCPSALGNEAKLILKDLNDAYDIYTAFPHRLSFEPGASWPLNVIVLPMAAKTYGNFVGSVYGSGYVSIELNSSLLSNMAEMRSTVGHEFMHFYQFVADPLNILIRVIQGSPNTWVDEAIAVYCEGLFSDSAHISAVRQGNEMTPYFGGINQSVPDAQDFGYGMAGMIKYLLRYEDFTLIGKIYSNIQEGQNSGDAILKAVNKDYKAWWVPFMSLYSQGKIFSDVGAGNMVGYASKTFEIKKITDTIQIYKSDFKQLESVIYRVNVNPDLINDMHILQVKAPEDAGIVILPTDNLKMEEAAKGVKEVKTGSLKQYTDDGYKIFSVVVTNLDYGMAKENSRSMETEIKLTTGNSMVIDFAGWIETNTYEKDKLVSSQTVLNGYVSPAIAMESNGNTMSGSWAGVATGNSSSPSLHTGTVTLIINPDHSVNIQLTDNVTTSLGWKMSYSLIASNIPKTSINQYGGKPSGYVTQFTRKTEFPNGDYINSSGPPFMSVNGDTGFIRITLQ